MLDLLKFIVVGGVLLTFTFLVLIALPKSKLREAIKPWVLALVCFAYVIWPVDILPEIALGPFGLLDDAGAVVAGFAAIRSAFKKTHTY